MKQVLEGIRVLDCTRIIAGPYCTFLLASMGAEVIRVEKPGGEIDWKVGPPIWEGTETICPPLHLGCNKKGITLDIRTDKGQEIFSDLVKKSDIVVQNYSYGGAEKLKLTYDHLKKSNSKIILVAISGFGQTGPYRERNCWDPNAQALSGMISLGGFPGTPPSRSPVPVIDFSAGCYGALGAMYALRHRDMTGEGQMIDIALFDVAISFTGMVAMEMEKAKKTRTQVGNASHWLMANTFKAKDGSVFISLATDPIWKSFCKLIGEEGLLDDPRYINDYHRFINREHLIPVIENWTSEKTVNQIVEITEANHIPCSPVNDIQTAMSDPQVLAREMLLKIDYGGNLGEVPIPGLVTKLSKTPGKIDKPCPSPGQDNDEIYRNLLGYESGTLENLAKDRVI